MDLRGVNPRNGGSNLGAFTSYVGVVVFETLLELKTPSLFSFRNYRTRSIVVNAHEQKKNPREEKKGQCRKRGPTAIRSFLSFSSIMRQKTKQRQNTLPSAVLSDLYPVHPFTPAKDNHKKRNIEVTQSLLLRTPDRGTNIYRQCQLWYPATRREESSPFPLSLTPKARSNFERTC